MKQITLKRNINVKAVVTPRLQEEANAQLQQGLAQIDNQIQQLEFQGRRAISDIERTSVMPLGPEVQQQIASIRNQVEQQKSEMLGQKNQLLQQMNQVATWEMGQEIVQGQIESFFTIQEGDNLVGRMNVEILLNDGVIKEIRGEV
jgi:hypothetical protein